MESGDERFKPTGPTGPADGPHRPPGPPPARPAAGGGGSGEAGRLDEAMARIARLEDAAFRSRRAAPLLRLATAGLASGFTALAVSWSLPWLRADVPIGGDGGYEIFSAPTRSATTGAELLGWAVLRPEGHQGMEITLVALVPILTAMLAAAAVLVHSAEATRVAATIAGGLGTISALLLWAGWDNSATVPTTGMLTALLGCAMVCASSALWSAGERAANGGPPP
ncbi:hypothetical protein [Nocardiopsis potens]|uniref:hypothetical protein n=1 Tax=Nocardiopsis potens TaxID=1246458 RepID=UPI0012682F34|nr:hypothetical protein [Nocardiopsis potens]